MIGVNEAFAFILLDWKRRTGMLSSYTSEPAFSLDQGRKAAAVDDTYHAKAHLFHIDMSRISMIADSQDILVEIERLLGGNEDLFITLALILVLS